MRAGLCGEEPVPAIRPGDGLVRRVVDLSAPAHVAATVTAAKYPFLVGMAALVGVDTYLGRRPPNQPIVPRKPLGP